MDASDVVDILLDKIETLTRRNIELSREIREHRDRIAQLEALRGQQ